MEEDINWYWQYIYRSIDLYGYEQQTRSPGRATAADGAQKREKKKNNFQYIKSCFWHQLEEQDFILLLLAQPV
jgi:hypothetical protein